MPANFSETLSVDQLRDLLSYLLSLRGSEGGFQEWVLRSRVKIGARGGT